MVRITLVASCLVASVLSVSLARLPVQPNGHIIEPGQPDYTYGVNDPTFTDDGQAHTFRTIEGDKPCCEKAGSAESSASLIQIGQEPTDRAFTTGPGNMDTHDENGGVFKWVTPCDCPNRYTKTSAEPNECAHCAQSGEGAGALIETSAEPAADDRTFTTGPGNMDTHEETGGVFKWITPCDCPHRYTTAAAEPNECAHCAQSGEGAFIETSAMRATKAVQEPTDRSFTTGPGNMDTHEETGGVFKWITPCDCPHRYTTAAAEPNECAHCAQSGESA